MRSFFLICAVSGEAIGEEDEELAPLPLPPPLSLPLSAESLLLVEGEDALLDESTLVLVLLLLLLERDKELDVVSSIPIPIPASLSAPPLILFTAAASTDKWNRGKKALFRSCGDGTWKSL